MGGAGLQPVQLRVQNGEDSPGRGEKGLALNAAGTVGDMVGGEAIKKFVHFANPFGITVGGQHKRKRGVAELPEACFAKTGEALAVPHFAVLPRGFQSIGVGKTTRREGGIGELPNEPFIRRGQRWVWPSRELRERAVGARTRQVP